MYFYIQEKSESNDHKMIKNASFGAAISPIDRWHQELLIAEIAAENDEHGLML